MEAEARYTAVGAGVLVLVALLVAALLWLGGQGDRAGSRLYTIHFEEQALDGLEIGGEVRLRGVRVGRVEAFALEPDSVNRVRVDVRVDDQASVRANTVAVVTRNLVTGIAKITLVTPDPPGPLLTQAPAGERHPVIGEGRSDLDQIAGRVSQVGEAATVALTQLNALLAPENRQTMMDTVRSLRALADDLRSRLDTLDTAATQVGRAADRIGALAAPVQTAVADLGRAGDRIAGVVERGGERLDGTLGEARQLMAESRSAITRLAAATETLEREAQATSRSLQGTAQGLDDQLAAAVSDLRLSADAALRVLDQLQDPRAALLGPAPVQLGPGERAP